MTSEHLGLTRSHWAFLFSAGVGLVALSVARLRPSALISIGGVLVGILREVR